MAALTMAALLPLAPVDMSAQEGGKAKAKDDGAPKGPTPRMPDGKVDFSGVYAPANFSNYGGALPLQPWAQKVYDDRRAGLSKDDPEGFCLPRRAAHFALPAEIRAFKDLRDSRRRQRP
jgi:hypothetical protein